jgi:hypothetical protein
MFKENNKIEKRFTLLRLEPMVLSLNELNCGYSLFDYSSKRGYALGWSYNN